MFGAPVRVRGELGHNILRMEPRGRREACSSRAVRSGLAPRYSGALPTIRAESAIGSPRRLERSCCLRRPRGEGAMRVIVFLLFSLGCVAAAAGAERTVDFYNWSD